MNAGEYLCTIIDANGCEFITEALTVEMESSVLDTEFDNSITLFPNPNDGNFFIEFEDLNLNLIQLDIINTTGQKLFSGVKEIKSKRVKINHDIQSGLYFVRLQADDKIALKRIIIQY